MAEKARTMPHQRGRGPRPKLDHPGQTLGRVLKYVGRKYWLHLIFVVVCILVSVFAMVQAYALYKDPHRQLYPPPGPAGPGRANGGFHRPACTPSPAWPCSTPAA